MRVWLDTKRLLDGVNWEQGFCNGLVQSRCFLPVISKAAIKQRFEALREDSDCDNVLLEHRLAGELQARGLIERIFPVFVGETDTATGQFGDFFRQGAAPSPASAACVASVETKLKTHLEAQGLGLPLKTAPSVKDVFAEITISQGGKITGAGSLDSILDSLTDRALNMVSDLAPAGTLTLTSPSLSRQSQTDREQELERLLDRALRRVAALEAAVADYRP